MIKIIIVFLLFILFYMFVTESSKKRDKYITGYVFLIIIIAITILTLIELFDWLLSSKVGTDLKNLIILFAIPLTLYLLMYFGAWKRRVKTCVYIPLNYVNKHVLIIYNQNDSKESKTNYSFVRKRKLKCDKNGIIQVKNSRTNLRLDTKRIEVKYNNGKKYNGYENRKVYIEKYDFKGYKCDLIIFDVTSNIYSQSVISTFPTIEEIMEFLNENR